MITDTVKPSAPLLIDRAIPDQAEIRNRMIRNFGKGSSLVMSIISPCAEEAERIVYDLLTTSVLKQPITIRASLHRGSRHLNRKRVNGYKCPSCSYHRVRVDMTYCPGCGKNIDWV